MSKRHEHKVQDCFQKVISGTKSLFKMAFTGFILSLLEGERCRVLSLECQVFSGQSYTCNIKHPDICKRLKQNLALVQRTIFPSFIFLFISLHVAFKYCWFGVGHKKVEFYHH